MAQRAGHSYNKATNAVVDGLEKWKLGKRRRDGGGIAVMCLPGTAAVTQQRRETGSSSNTHGAGRHVSRRKMCACSSHAAARLAGLHSSSPCRALRSDVSSSSASSRSGHDNAAATTSISAGSASSSAMLPFYRGARENESKV
jgi:hypothetical protein